MEDIIMHLGRKILRCVTAAAVSALMLCAASICASAEVKTDDTTKLKYEIIETGDTSTVTITGYEGTDTTLVIPDKLEDITVTEIADNAFYNKDVLTSITVPTGVTKIGKAAFRDCSSLETLTVQGNITEASESMCEDCYKLKTVTLPSTVTKLGVKSFKNIGLQVTGGITFNIPSGVKTLCSWCLGGAEISGITIPASVETIENGAFIESKLKSVTIPASVTTLGSDNETSLTNYGGVFMDCEELETAIINAPVTKLPPLMFSGCSKLKNVTISPTVNEIGEDAFNNCTSLASITLPTSLIKIDDNAFYGCTALAEITIPENTTSIADNAFGGCTLLKQVTVKNNNTVIDDNAFGTQTGIVVIAYPGSKAQTFANTKAGISFLPMRDLHIVNMLNKNVSFAFNGGVANNGNTLTGEYPLIITNNESAEVEIDIKSGTATVLSSTYIQPAASYSYTIPTGTLAELTVTVAGTDSQVSVGKLVKPEGVTVYRNSHPLANGTDLHANESLTIIYNGDKILKVNDAPFTSGNAYPVSSGDVVIKLAPKLILQANDVSVTRSGSALSNGSEIAVNDVLTITYTGTGSKTIKVNSEILKTTTYTVKTDNNVTVSTAVTLYKPTEVTVKRADGTSLPDGAELVTGETLTFTYSGTKSFKINNVIHDPNLPYTVGNYDVTITLSLNLSAKPSDVSVKLNGTELNAGDSINTGDRLVISYSGTRVMRINGDVFIPDGIYIVQGKDVSITLTDELPTGILTKPSDVYVYRNGQELSNGTVLYIGDMLRVSYTGKKLLAVNGSVSLVSYEPSIAYIYTVNSGDVVITLTDPTPSKTYAGQLYKPSGTYVIRDNAYLEAGERLYIGDRLIIGYFSITSSGMTLRVNGTIFSNGSTINVNNVGDIVVTLESASSLGTSYPSNPVFPAVTYYVSTSEYVPTPTPATTRTGSGTVPRVNDDDFIDDDGDDDWDDDDDFWDDDDWDDDDDWYPGSERNNGDVTVELVNELDGLTVNDPHIRTKMMFFPEDAQVILSRPQSARNAAVAALKQLNYTDPVVYSFDISIKDNMGNDISLTGNSYITFIIPVPKILLNATGDIDVYHIVNNVPVYVTSSTYTNSSGVRVIEFRSTDFSPYMFSANVKGGSSDAYIDDIITPSGSGHNGNINPHTGAVAAVLIPAAVTGCVFLARKNNPSRKRADPVANAKKRARRAKRSEK